VTITRETGGPAAWFEMLDEGDHEGAAEAAAEAPPINPGIRALDEGVVKQTIAGEHPKVDPTPNLTVELPRGIHHDGVWHTDVHIRELTGRDEEHLSRFKTEEEVLDGILALGTVRVGSIDLSKEPVSSRTTKLGNLLVGERLMVYLAIVRATFGNEKNMEFTCGSCETQNNTTILLDTDFPAEIPEDIEESVFTYTTRSGSVIVYRPVTGADVMSLNFKGSDKLSQSERNSRILARIIKNVDGEPPFSVDDYVRDLGMKDRLGLLTEVSERQPNIEWMLKIECVGCHEEVSIPVHWGSLFRA
jgi:hypothetical protein